MTGTSALEFRVARTPQIPVSEQFTEKLELGWGSFVAERFLHKVESLVCPFQC